MDKYSDSLIDCRAAFEKWIIDNSQVRKEEIDLLERFPESGHYRLQTTYAGWEAWRTAWEHSSLQNTYYCFQEHAGKGRCWNGRLSAYSDITGQMQIDHVSGRLTEIISEANSAIRAIADLKLQTEQKRE
jgi:hypothetical protein